MWSRLTTDRQERVNGLVLALDGLVRAVPTVQGNAAYHRVTRAARAALEAAAQVVLSEAQWRHVDDVLAAFVPDFGREQSDAERGELIKAVVQPYYCAAARRAYLVVPEIGVLS